MIARINESKYEQNTYHTNANVNLMVENVTRIESGITINVSVCAISFVPIRLYVEACICTCEDGKYEGSNINDSVIMCDETIQETKTFPTKSISTKSNSK